MSSTCMEKLNVSGGGGVPANQTIHSTNIYCSLLTPIHHLSTLLTDLVLLASLCYTVRLYFFLSLFHKSAINEEIGVRNGKEDRLRKKIDVERGE